MLGNGNRIGKIGKMATSYLLWPAKFAKSAGFNAKNIVVSTVRQ